MANADLPTPDKLRQLVRYDPETGKLFWKERGILLFTDGCQSAKHNCHAWNAKNAGKEAFTACNRGYRQGAIYRRTMKAHRAAWAIYYGRWPEAEIDHIDGDPQNNRIENLRDVSRLENLKNVARRLDNSSGATGVYWDARRSHWYAQIKLNGKAIHLGCFPKQADAISARKEAERGLGFHPNHGR